MSSARKVHHIHFSTLIAQARLKAGFGTLKELYRELNPEVDYQTWMHAEAGRRIPVPETAVAIGSLLGIEREEVLIAYCKDKFPDEESQQVLDAFRCRRFVEVDTLIEAKDHDRSQDYMLNTKQVEAIRSDLRIRLFLTYTWDQEFRTTIGRLAEFFATSTDEVRSVLERTADLGLIEMHGDEVKRIHRHLSMPKTAEAFKIRKDLLLAGLEINVDESSYISNIHTMLSQESYKKMLTLFDLAEANLIKLDKEEYDGPNRYQFVVVANRIEDGSQR